MLRRVICVAPLMVVVGLSVLPAQDRADQSVIAVRLGSTDDAERSRALAAAAAIPPADVQPALRKGLITALERENAEVRRRRLALWRGESVEPREHPFYGDVLQAVTKLQDPAAIPALTEALGTGGMVTKALAGFGERAAPRIIAIVNTPDRPAEQVQDGLIALNLMGERPDLSPATRRSIAAAVKGRLSGKQHPVVLYSAISAAKTLKDPELTAAVAALASGPPAVDDPQEAEKVRLRAADALESLQRF